MILSDTFVKCICRNMNCGQGKWSLHSRWSFISTFTELHIHGDERWPMEVMSNACFRGVVGTRYCTAFSLTMVYSAQIPVAEYPATSPDFLTNYWLTTQCKVCTENRRSDPPSPLPPPPVSPVPPPPWFTMNCTILSSGSRCTRAHVPTTSGALLMSHAPAQFLRGTWRVSRGETRDPVLFWRLPETLCVSEWNQRWW